MNQRLQSIYLSIEQANEKTFNNNELEIDTYWNQPVWGITLQIDLSDEVRDILIRYQNELHRLEPDNLLLLPREYQHISLKQVVYWNGHYSLGTEQTWNSIANEFLSKFTALDSTYDSFPVTFSKLIATTGGIIWCAFDQNDEMEKLRNDLLLKLPFPEETLKRNHFIHTTVARFKNKLNNPAAVVDYIRRQTKTSAMIINNIKLKKELIYPSIKTETLAQITLK